MKKITLTNYTHIFNDKFRENAIIDDNIDVKIDEIYEGDSNSGQHIPMIPKHNIKENVKQNKIRTVERIDKLLDKIDIDIRELKNIVDESLSFESDTDELMKRFKIYSDQINILANNLLKIIKTYENNEPLVYRQYIVLLQERLRFAEAVSAKFKKHHIVLKQNKYETKTKMNKKSNYDVIEQEMMDRRDDTDDKPIQKQEQQLIMKNDQLTRFVEERAELIDNIASSISELHQQFVDLQTLVAVQGEMIDHINDNMITSLKYTQEGAKELDEAKEHDDTYTKLKRKIYGGVIGVGVSATVVLGTLKGMKLWGWQ